MTDDPCAQDGGRALCGRQQEAQFKNFPETIVSAMGGIFGGGSGLYQSLAQHIRVGQRDAQGGLEYSRFVLSVSVKRVE